MELFEQIRREYEYGEGTIKGVARKLGIHRRMVPADILLREEPEAEEEEDDRKEEDDEEDDDDGDEGYSE